MAPPTISPEIRFWKHVDKQSEHWLWTGAKSDSGYGWFALRPNKLVLAHRYAYELEYGLPKQDVLHKEGCDIKLCVRYEHLYDGSFTDNMRDAFHGEHGYNAKLTQEQVDMIRDLYTRKKFNQLELATIFLVSERTILRIVNNQTWNHKREHI